MVSIIFKVTLHQECDAACDNCRRLDFDNYKNDYCDKNHMTIAVDREVYLYILCQKCMSTLTPKSIDFYSVV